MATLSTALASSFASTSSGAEAALTLHTTTDARAANPLLMAPSTVLLQRRFKTHTPLQVDTWQAALECSGLVERYPRLVQSVEEGFIVGVPPLSWTFVPLNSSSMKMYAEAFEKIVRHELEMEQYIGPFLRATLESLIGLFQTSPLSLTPKPKPNAFCLIQNFLYPYTSTDNYRSLNSYINSDDYPCMWATFTAISLMLSRLPSGSQVAVRDVSEAYRIISLHPSQWPGTIIRYSENDQFIVDTSAAFGLASNTGVFGHKGDALADYLRFCSMIDEKWVDDYLVSRILREHIAAHNSSGAAI